ncbi:MAG TPA: 30S ribosomal protein S18 [Candidatus Krumholzibacteria bacterium]|nr:30S ribosomal protein S18 [Candidatus Krumholzibacteria bacterium]
MASRKRDNRRKKKRADRRGGKPKKCWFTENAIVAIDYKDIDLLRRFVSERGKISPRRNTGTSPKMQRELAKAVKRARHLALLPFVKEYYR